MNAIAKAPPPRLEGVVEEILPGPTFKIRTGDGRDILGHLAGKLRLHHVRVVAGDRVLLEVSPDGKLGRIVRRL